MTNAILRGKPEALTLRYGVTRRLGEGKVVSMKSRRRSFLYNLITKCSLVGLIVAGSAAWAGDFTPDTETYAICMTRGSSGNSATDVTRWSWPGDVTSEAMHEDIKYYSEKGAYFTIAKNTTVRFPGLELVLDGSGKSGPPWGTCEVLLSSDVEDGCLLLTNAIVYGNTEFTGWNTTIAPISGRMEIRSRPGKSVHFLIKNSLDPSSGYMKLKNLTLVGGATNPIEMHTATTHSISNANGGKMTVYLTDCDFSQYYGTNTVYVYPSSGGVDRSIARTRIQPNDMTMGGTLVLDDCSILSLANVTSELVVSNLVIKGGAKIEGLAAGKTIRITGSLETDCTNGKKIEIDLTAFTDPGSGVADALTLFTLDSTATHEKFNVGDLVFSGLKRKGVEMSDWITAGWSEDRFVLTAPECVTLNTPSGATSYARKIPATDCTNWIDRANQTLTAHIPTAVYLMTHRAYMEGGSTANIVFAGAHQVLTSTVADEIMLGTAYTVTFPDLHLYGYAGFKTWASTGFAGISGRVTIHSTDTNKSAFVSLDYKLAGSEASSVENLTNLTLVGTADDVFEVRGAWIENNGANTCGGGQTSFCLTDCDFSGYAGLLRFHLPAAPQNDYTRSTARLVVKPNDMTFGGEVVFRDSAVLALDRVTDELAFSSLVLGSNSYIRAASPSKTIRVATRLATEAMGEKKVEVDVANLWGGDDQQSMDLFTCAKDADTSAFAADRLTYVRKNASVDRRIVAEWVETDSACIFRVWRRGGTMLIFR